MSIFMQNGRLRQIVARSLWLVGVWVGPACSTSPATPVAPAEAAAPTPTRVVLSDAALAIAAIDTEVLARSTRGPALALPATLEADPTQVARVGARVTGRVAQLRVQIGERVAQGAALVELDTVELHQISTEYLIAQARLRYARDVLARARLLHTQNVGSTQELRRAESEQRVASATMQEAEEHLHFLGLSERDIGRVRSQSSHGSVRAIVRAPIAGRVASLPVSLGQVVSGTETVAVIGDAARVWLVASVFQRDLAVVRTGAEVSVQIEGQTTRFRSTIAAISDVLDPTTRTASARAALDNPDRALRDGMSATAWVNTEAPSALWIDEAAVVIHDGSPAVFVRVAANTFVLRRVQTTGGQSNRVAIASGVAAGEVVVVRGAFALLGELERASRGEEN
ncbi:MAG: efflux RND transporter periplasmic adaptor subunit [Deltaproteobacteria bacterium]|nr:efflux RND transporter periplasmic adaptor subunit [Deltaproteobacteria bacterium]